MDNNNLSNDYSNDYAPEYGYDTPQDPALNSKAILVLGILSCALCWAFGAGIILGAIGLSKAKAYAAIRNFDGKARAGKITSIVGLASSIFFVIYWAVMIIGAIAIVGAYSAM